MGAHLRLALWSLACPEFGEELVRFSMGKWATFVPAIPGTAGFIAGVMGIPGIIERHDLCRPAELDKRTFTLRWDEAKHC